MTRKKGERTSIWSIFGVFEKVVADRMIKDGEVTYIAYDDIPYEVRFNDKGKRAYYAIIIPNKKIPAFNKAVELLRS